MREILFRGQTRRYGEKVRIGDGRRLPSKWVYGGIFPGTGDFSIIYGAKKEDFTGADIEKYTVYSDTVGQYTGLKDKNGKRIFEGDIIKYAYNLDYNCFLESVERPEDYEGCDYSDIFTIDKVVYCDESDYPAFDLDKHNFDCNGLAELVVSMEYHYEVIGNIHDHPERLEGGQNNR